MNTMSPLSANLSCTMQILIWRNQSQNIDQHFIWQFLYPRISLHDCDKIHFRFIWQIFKKYFCKMYCCFDLILVLPVILLQKVAITLRKEPCFAIKSDRTLQVTLKNVTMSILLPDYGLILFPNYS